MTQNDDGQNERNHMDVQRIISLVKETKGIITNREMAARVKEKGVADYVTQVDACTGHPVSRGGNRLAADECRLLLDS